MTAPAPVTAAQLAAAMATMWKVTLPTDTKTKGKADEFAGADMVKQFGKTAWFRANAAGTGVSFRAPVNGITTSGSKNPRAELRQMDGKGGLAKWSAGKPADGASRLRVVMSFDALPNDTKALVGAQIHDAKNDISVWRLEGNKLYITKGNDDHYRLVDGDYQLGAVFEATFIVYNGLVRAFYNGVLVATVDAPGLADAYFKAGAYTQANAKNSKPAAATNYGQTTIYDIEPSHTAAPGPDPAPGQPQPAPGPTPAPTPDPAPTPVPAPPVVAAKVIVLRHAEKPKDKKNHSLSDIGKARAARLVAVFRGVLVRAGVSRPDRFYASMGKTASRRPLETIQPSAAELGVPIVTKWDAAHAKDAGKEIAKLTGVTAVSWAHEELPDLVKAMGKASPTPPSSWPDSRYDIFWIFDKQPDGSWRFSQSAQMLLDGDKLAAIKASALRTVGRWIRRAVAR